MSDLNGFELDVMIEHNIVIPWLTFCGYVNTCLQGAATTCFVALHPSVKGVSGKYFVDNNEFDPKTFHPLAEDEQEAKKLWDLSVQLTSTWGLSSKL